VKPTAAEEASVSYLLIAARAYSGSTLLAALLGAHPQIATVSEVSGSRREGRMDTFRCSCGERMVDCPFWQAMQARMRNRGYPDFRLGNFELNFSRGRGWFERLRTGSLRWSLLEGFRDRAFAIWPGHTASMRQIGRRNKDFAESVLEETGARVFVDTSKERMRIRYLRRFMPMELRVIHLVRDVRGVVDSIGRHAGHPIDVGAAARDWTSTNRTLMRHTEDLPPDKGLVLRYEDLCADPAGTLDAIHTFCGVSRLASGPSSGHGQHLLGNERRLETDWTRINLDERWRSRLSNEELARIAETAGAIARRLYPELDGDGAPTSQR
jgi:hypothetical protein